MEDWLAGGVNSIYTKVRFLKWWSYNLKGLDTLYPAWMKYECGIVHPQYYTRAMIEQGYIGLASKRELLPKKLVAELREILAEAGLSTKGRKQELIDRITENIDVESLPFPPIFYTITDKAREYLGRYAEVLTAQDFHEKYYIKIQEYIAAKSILGDTASSDKVLYRIFSDKIREHTENNNFGSLRCVYYNLAFKHENDGNFADCERIYCAVLFYDLSGLDDSNYYSFSRIFFAEAVVDKIYKYKEYFNYTDLVSYLKTLYVPRTMTDFNTYMQVISDIFSRSLKTIEDYIPPEKRVYSEYELLSKEMPELTEEQDAAIEGWLNGEEDLDYEEWCEKHYINPKTGEKLY